MATWIYSEWPFLFIRVSSNQRRGPDFIIQNNVRGFVVNRDPWIRASTHLFSKKFLSGTTYSIYVCERKETL